MTNDIMVNGKSVKVPCSVVRDPKLQFTALGKRTETRAVVVHHTGGEGGGEQVFSVLKERGLSVQFAIDQKGIVYQYADAVTRCSHAGTANGWSVGIEVANRANGESAHAKWPRTLVDDMLRGKKVRYADFFPAQYTATLQLAKALCAALGIPFECPLGKDGKVLGATLSPSELQKVKGFIGHYHITDRKVDPYVKIMQYLVDHK